MSGSEIDKHIRPITKCDDAGFLHAWHPVQVIAVPLVIGYKAPLREVCFNCGLIRLTQTKTIKEVTYEYKDSVIRQKENQ